MVTCLRGQAKEVSLLFLLLKLKKDSSNNINPITTDIWFTQNRIGGGVTVTPFPLGWNQVNVICSNFTLVYMLYDSELDLLYVGPGPNEHFQFSSLELNVATIPQLRTPSFPAHG